MPAASCVFIDDIAENVEGARRAGLTALHYVDTPTLIADLRRAGVEVPGESRADAAPTSARSRKPMVRSAIDPEPPGGVEHPDDEAVLGVEVEPVERPLDFVPTRIANSRGGELEQGVELEARAAAQGILDGHPARADVARGADLERATVDLARGLRRPQGGEQAEVAVAQVGAAVGDPALALEVPVGIEEAIGIDQEVRARARRGPRRASRAGRRRRRGC